MKNIKNKKGVALISVLIIIAVAAVLATALFAYANNNILQTKTIGDRKKAEYLARTGVETTVNVWKNVSYNSIERETEPVYLLDDGTYVSVGSGGSAPADYVGYYTVVINPNKEVDTNGDGVNDTKVAEFTSTAVVGKATATKSAYIMPSLNAYDQGWYNDGGVPNKAKLTSNDNLKLTNSTVRPSSTYTTDLLSAFFPGNIYFPRPGGAASNFALKVTENKEFIAYGGNILYLDMGITMNSSSAYKSVLVLSGGDIIITGDIELYVYYGFLGSGIGTVILSVLQDYAHIDPTRQSDGASYGKIYFYGDVYITRAWFFGTERRKIFSKGTVYYFKGLDNGVDLVKYYVDNEGAGGVIASFIASLYPSTGTVDNNSMRQIQPGVVAADDASEIIPPSLDDSPVIVWTS